MKKSVVRVILWVIIVLLLLSAPIFFFMLGILNRQYGPNTGAQNNTQWVCRNSKFEFCITEETAPCFGIVLIQEREYPIELVFDRINSVEITFRQSRDDVPLVTVFASYVAFSDKVYLYNVEVSPSPDVPMEFYSFFHNSFVFEKV